MLSNKSNPLSCMIINGSKKKKLEKKKKANPLYLTLFLARIVWIDKLHDLMKRFLSYKGCHENRQKTFFQLSWQ